MTLEWFASPQNTKPLALLIFFVTFIGILLYVFGSKRRGEKLEAHKHIPFLDERDEERETRP